MTIQSSFVRSLGSLVVFAALPASIALAGGDSHKSSDKDKSEHSQAAAASVQGTVQAVSPKSMTVRDSAGNMTKVEFSKDTHYDNSGKAGSVSDLRAGMTVSIDCAKEKDGSLQATAIRYDKKAPVEHAPS